MNDAESLPARGFVLAATLLASLAACSGERGDERSDGTTGLLIRNVHIVDGSGSPAYTADLRISGGRIASIGALEPQPGEAVFDGGGRTLAPGFIDTHSHADDDLLEHPDALAAVSQGITTVVGGQDGGSPYPLAEYFERIAQTGTAVNVALYVGHNTLRGRVLGEDYRRAATDAEVAAMAALLEEELASGALGLSTGLEYDPGIYSDPAEVLRLAEVTAAAGGRYISHVRSEDRWFERALEEIIDIGRATGMPVQISHFKLAMTRLWGEAPQILARLDAARNAGIRITADLYPYEYWQSNLMVLLPERDYTDRAAVEQALSEIAPPDGLWFTRFDPEPDYVGKTLTEIAALRGVDAVTAFMQLAEASTRLEQQTGEGADSIIGTSMREEDIRQLLRWHETNICTDGALVDLHPRARGAFTRVLGRYVREEKLLSLEEAVYKMTGLAARHMGFADRGLIRPGAIADLVLFDRATVSDRASPDAPQRLSEGIAAVWVGGEQVYDGSRTTGARPGKIIRGDILDFQRMKIENVPYSSGPSASFSGPRCCS